MRFKALLDSNSAQQSSFVFLVPSLLLKKPERFMFSRYETFKVAEVILWNTLSFVKLRRRPWKTLRNQHQNTITKVHQIHNTPTTYQLPASIKPQQQWDLFSVIYQLGQYSTKWTHATPTSSSLYSNNNQLFQL